VRDGTLKDKFPRLYKVLDTKDFLVCDLSLRIGNGNTQEYIWQIPWRRELFDWEKDLEKQLFEISTLVIWRGDSFDKWCWVDEKIETYTVQFGYWAMKAIPNILRNDFLSKVWSLKVPGIAKVFGLRVLIDRLPSKINLEKRGVRLRVIYVLCVTRMHNLFSILCYHVRFHRDYGSSVISG